MKIIVRFVVLFLVVLVSSTLFASPKVSVDRELPAETVVEEIVDAIDYLDNGTLYNQSIHHRRPAKGIHDTREKKHRKSFADAFSYSVTSDFLSKYVFEGVASSRGWVWQPSATIEAYGVGFNVWGNFVMDNIPDQGKFNEIDLTLYYDFNYKGLNIHPFFLACLYPTSNKVSLDYSAYSDLKPQLHVAYSLGPVDIYTDMMLYAHPTPGAFDIDFGLGFQHNLAKRVGITTAAQISFGNSKYNNSQFGINKNRFHHFTYQLGLSVNPVKGLVIEPNINVAAFFSQQFRNAVRFPVLIWGGVDLTYNF